MLGRLRAWLFDTDSLDQLPERVRETTGGPALVVLGEVLREILDVNLNTEAERTQRAQRTANE